MRVIRDDDCNGIMMIPLLHDWGVTRCNVADCTEKPNTIVSDPENGYGPAGICETHYREAEHKGKWDFHLVDVPTFEPQVQDA